MAEGEYGPYRLDSPELQSHLRSATELLRLSTTGDEDVVNQWAAAHGTIKLRDLVPPEAIPSVKQRLLDAVSAGGDPAEWPTRLADEVATVVVAAASRALTLTAMAHVLIANRLLNALADATRRPIAELLQEIDAWTVEELRDKQFGDKR